MTTKPTNAARVAAHKARGKYISVTISLQADGALFRIQRHYDCSQRAAIELALLDYAERIQASDAMREGAP